jgi:hypothetical protein
MHYIHLFDTLTLDSYNKGVIRRTNTQLAVAKYFAADPTAWHYSWEITHALEISSGVVHPMLLRWLEHGWLEDRHEDPEEAKGHGGPRRRYFRPTKEGLLMMQYLTKPFPFKDIDWPQAVQPNPKIGTSCTYPRCNCPEPDVACTTNDPA